MAPTTQDPPDPALFAKPDLYVVARFLDKLGEAGAPYPRSQLQMAVRLNYDLYRKYLAFLEAKGFVALQGEGRATHVALTPRGLEARRQLVQWIRGVLGEGPL